MNWSNEPATETQLGRLRQLGYCADCPLTKAEAANLIKLFEPLPDTEAGEAEMPSAARHAAYALRLTVEHTRRALAEAPQDQAQRLQQSLTSAIAKRQEFWKDTCRNPVRMQSRSAPVVDLYMKYGCRFVAPTPEQVQEVLNALDRASPLWDRDHPELFYQTLELNFAELLRRT